MPVELVCPAGEPIEPVEPLVLLCAPVEPAELEAFGELMSLEDEDEVLGEALWLLVLDEVLAPVVELVLDCAATLPVDGD